METSIHEKVPEKSIGFDALSGVATGFTERIHKTTYHQ